MVCERSIDRPSRTMHFGIAVLGVLAYLSGDITDSSLLGYLVHAWLGLMAGVFLLGRLALGVLGPKGALFRNWFPVTKARLKSVLEDVRGLLVLKLPKRDPHEGLAGALQAFGLVVFSWMAASGLLIYVLGVPGERSSATVHMIEEAHEAGAGVLVFFLVLHVGGAFVHQLAGRNYLKRMFFLER